MGSTRYLDQAEGETPGHKHLSDLNAQGNALGGSLRANEGVEVEADVPAKDIVRDLTRQSTILCRVTTLSTNLTPCTATS